MTDAAHSRHTGAGGSTTGAIIANLGESKYSDGAASMAFATLANLYGEANKPPTNHPCVTSALTCVTIPQSNNQGRRGVPGQL